MKRIDEVFLFVADDETGEGIMAFRDPRTSTWIPMIAADEDRLRSLIPLADEVSVLAEKPYRVVRYATRSEVDLDLYRVKRDGEIN